MKCELLILRFCVCVCVTDLGSGQEVVQRLETKVFVGNTATNKARTELSTVSVAFRTAVVIVCVCVRTSKWERPVPCGTNSQQNCRHGEIFNMPEPNLNQSRNIRLGFFRRSANFRRLRGPTGHFLDQFKSVEKIIGYI